MSNPFISKLERLSRLNAPERQAVEEAMARPREVRADVDIVEIGARPAGCTVLLDGWACRYKLLPGGKRQITSFLIPGDPCDLGGFVVGRMDHSVGTLTPATVAYIPGDLLQTIMDHHPDLARALWQETLVEGAVAREWVVNVGRRSAMERIAHLLCELRVRLDAAGLADGPSFMLPVTQAEIADATGLSFVHVNRVLQELRGRKVIAWAGDKVEVRDWESLRRIGGFDPDYLFLALADRTTDVKLSVR